MRNKDALSESGTLVFRKNCEVEEGHEGDVAERGFIEGLDNASINKSSVRQNHGVVKTGLRNLMRKKE